MGPPKAKPFTLTYKQKLDRYDMFEQFYDNSSGQMYLVNPYTGETIFGTDVGLVDRTKSMWSRVDGRTRVGVVIVHLYPAYYQSRRWGRRPFHGWNGDEEAAATHIAAVTRGYLERLALKQYFKHRYQKRQCQFSGYFYFYDTYNTDKNVEPSWHKPILAFPDDVDEYIPPDPEDYLKGDKFTYRGFDKGPYLTRVGIKKHELRRAKESAFIKPDPLREKAISSIKDIDLDATPLGTLIEWMDGSKTGWTIISDYTNMRAAVEGNNWVRVHEMLNKYQDRPLTHAYALFAFSKMEMEIERDGGYSIPCADAWFHCKKLIDDPLGNTPKTLKVFALMVWERFLAIPQGRAEFFNTTSVKTTGKKRQRAIEEFLQGQMRILTQQIEGIDYESQTFKSKFGAKEEYQITVHFPTRRGADIAALGMSCLSLLGQEQEHRELMSETITKPIIGTMLKCEEETLVQAHGLRALYNMMYRCHAAQETILLADWKKLLQMLKTLHSGDPELHMLTRRFELSLQPEGWRGAIEKQLSMEMEAMRKAQEKNSTHHNDKEHHKPLDDDELDIIKHEVNHKNGRK